MNRHLFLLFLCFLAACQRPSTATQTTAIEAPTRSLPIKSPPASQPTIQSTQTPMTQPTTTSISTPFFTGSPSPHCGQLLPIISNDPMTQLPMTQLQVKATALENLRAIAPDKAWPAIQQMIDQPQTVGLALYQVGDEENGVYINANRPMPVASLAKIITLAAYAEAINRDELNPNTAVSLEILNQYYLPHFDLGAHPRAIRELRENGRLLNNETAVALEDIAWMMMRHSSNAAADYLHRLLGQQRIEETAVGLGFTSHTAPCTFLGQFLAMGNHTRGGVRDRTAVDTYLENPNLYQQEVELLADAYITQQSFRDAEQAWRGRFRNPSLETQKFFSHELAPQATPIEYANLMARIAQNGLDSPESSFIARRIIEWPMQFPANQERFTNLGYKNGSLPSILTTVYYAYRPGDSAPVVIALFYKALPNRTYRNWRNTLPDDEFARWALADPAAIPALRALLTHSQPQNG